jgi:hypothetical protein
MPLIEIQLMSQPWIGVSVYRTSHCQSAFRSYAVTFDAPVYLPIKNGLGSTDKIHIRFALFVLPEICSVGFSVRPASEVGSERSVEN